SPEPSRKCVGGRSAAAQSASTRLGEGGNQPIEMPPLPGDLELAPQHSNFHEESPRQVFLHSRCQKSRKPYLMRFARRPYDGRYEAIASHPLDALEEGDGAEEGDGDLLPPINSSLLDGCPPCPYCNEPAAGMCPCGALFCVGPNQRGPVVCPACRSELRGGTGGDFDIRRASG